VIVAQFMKPVAPNDRKSKTSRDRTTYRAARRNIAKIAYRAEKKRRKAS
jgi:hypothetical protein